MAIAYLGHIIIFILSGMLGQPFSGVTGRRLFVCQAANLSTGWNIGDHASESVSAHLLLSLRFISGNAIYVCVSLFFHDDDDGVRLELFFNFLNLNCFHRPGLGLSNSLLRNLCVQVQPRLSLYPVTHTTQADLWSSALANRVLSLLCNHLFLG